jgi:DNA-binding Lrp family transcriptional regulator
MIACFSSISKRALREFQQIVQDYLRQEGGDLIRQTQAQLAQKIGLTERELSDRLKGRRILTQTNVQNIVEALMEWGKIKTRAEVTTLFQLTKCPDFPPEKWREIEINSRKIYPHLDEGRRRSLREDLSHYDLTAMLERVKKEGYQRSILESFIRDKTEAEGLRIFCLNIYFHKYNYTNILHDLIKDPLLNIRLEALKIIPQFELKVDSSLLIKAFQSAEQDLVVNAVRASKFLILKQGIDPSILVDDAIVKHPYWLVRRIAIGIIIDFYRDDTGEEDIARALNLLSYFYSVTYHKSREDIYLYIESLIDKGYLTPLLREQALFILNTFINDEKSSPNKIKRMKSIVTRIYEQSEESKEV